MHVLVINPGSSSIKFSLYAQQGNDLFSVYEGEVSGIGSPAPTLDLHDARGLDRSADLGTVRAGSMAEAIALVERAAALPGFPTPDAAGYRVVHPGPHLRGHQRLTAGVLKELRAAVAFAPLHDPIAIEIIHEMMQRLPVISHFACFDTVFHETMPEEAFVYPLPKPLLQRGVRRYGFHGLSCESIIAQLRTSASIPFPASLLIAHLGSGCSVTACIDGKSVDTTMGLTPTGGVVMGTRPGDLDPGLILYLLRQPGATLESVEAMLNHDSGLKALAGTSDMRELRSSTSTGETALALRIFVRTLVKTVGGLAALHCPAAIVFTGGIGEHDPQTRADVTAELTSFGVELDSAANDTPGKALRKVSTKDSRVAIYIVPAEEDRTIAGHVVRMTRSI